MMSKDQQTALSIGGERTSGQDVRQQNGMPSNPFPLFVPCLWKLDHDPIVRFILLISGAI
jgi:hypothetical protein